MAPRTGNAAGLSRVAVWFGGTQIDLALPARDPIGDYIDEVVDTLSQQVDLPAGGPTGQWTLARPDRPLKPETSLADARVDDGAILELRLVAPTERYRPIIEDVVDAVAAAASANTRPFDADAARSAGLVGLAVGGAALCAGQWGAWAASGYRWFAALAGIVLALAALGAMWSAAKRYRAEDAAAAWSVVWIAWATCLAQVIPVSVRTGRPGLAHVVVAAVAVAAAALVALWVTVRHTSAYSAVVATALAGAVSVGVVQYGGVAASSVAAGALAFGLVGLSAAPRMATMLAQITLPRIPAPGQEVDNAADLSDAEMDLLQRRAQRAVALTLGLTSAAVIVICAAAAFVIDPHSHHRWIQIGIVLCALVVLVVTGRMLPDRRLSFAMFTGAGVVLAISVARLLIGWPQGAAPAVVLLVAAALIAAAVLSALVVVRRSVPETVTNWIDRLRLIALAVAIPLCVWATGLFGAIRDIPFR